MTFFSVPFSTEFKTETISSPGASIPIYSATFKLSVKKTKKLGDYEIETRPLTNSKNNNTPSVGALECFTGNRS